ncbi:MAG: RNA-binding protein, partial [Zoogloeaceae bacterium]|nr:RNA-binding protein [Zoogloeaceae bacterium]
QPGGGTNVSAPLAWLNARKASVDLVLLVSDNESWLDDRRHGATQTMLEWRAIKARCPQAKLVCIDIQPNSTTQAHEQADILNVGGFSDAVFTALAAFVNDNDANHWVERIEKIALNPIEG